MREKQSKATQERHERLLNELCKSNGNKKCADCYASNPRWASYSLGIFLCIRCASIHRKMGTHLSKVKSVSMDQWSAQEIQNMKEKGGNNKVNGEIISNNINHSLPLALDDNFAMEKYIRDKWERRIFEAKRLEIDTREESLFPTPSTSSTASSILSSPKQTLFSSPSRLNANLPSPLAGRGFNENNPYLKQNTNPFLIKPYNPFLQ